MLGFRNYREYLDSRMWHEIRAKALALRPRCYGCGARANEVHHRSYHRTVLQGKVPSMLSPVCSRCHREAELAQGRKVPVAVANRRLDQIRERTRRAAWERAKRERSAP